MRRFSDRANVAVFNVAQIAGCGALADASAILLPELLPEKTDDLTPGLAAAFGVLAAA